ncbi:putative nucleotidyltransferase substrate binding domain-containing protein [Mycolicibacterium mageritense]|uniref:putative nucleotidyltransferase substrate binding domain-containing protein n=1 Tax=Mycolicibacterium mageritense TaxID=53462 RepID=UPI001E4834D6|nr:putative nucleotidyltransferase substrate binding domain-containing protein [Mycolicibacterium mageritense]GJJ17516.1 hypothetical protein MTY414_11890 [Mycolicibacterium mageritense]
MPEGPLDLARTRIASADSATALAAASREAHDAVHEVVEARAGAATVASAWSALVRAALTTAARLTGAGRPAGAWYASGSVGRGDALPGSDLETLFVRNPEIPLDTALRQADAVHELLAECGFVGDPNGAVATRAQFSRTEREWAASIGRWAADPDTDRGVVMMGLLADADPVTAGPDLREQVGIAARAHPGALSAMLQDATFPRAHVPSRLRALTSGDGGVDLKYATVDPVVRIARWAALSCGSEALTTTARISDAAGSRYLDSEDARTLAKCHSIASSIRWRVRSARWDGAPDDRVDLSTLPPQDRTALRSIGREISGLRRKLDYLASTSTFSTW